VDWDLAAIMQLEPGSIQETFSAKPLKQATSWFHDRLQKLRDGWVAARGGVSMHHRNKS